MTMWPLYSTDGPTCPYCRHQDTPDEGFYYDESTDELECGECLKAYSVRVSNSTSWSTKPKDCQARAESNAQKPIP